MGEKGVLKMGEEKEAEKRRGKGGRKKASKIREF